MRSTGRVHSVVALLVLMCLVGGCGAARSVDDVADDIVRAIGGNSDDVARWLRGSTSTQDDAVRLGEQILESTPRSTAAESRVGTWIDDTISSLSAPDQAYVRRVAVGATCDAFDAVAQGRVPDPGSVVNGIATLSPSVDQQLLKTQLNEMWANLQRGEQATFAARAEILIACIFLDG